MFYVHFKWHNHVTKWRTRSLLNRWKPSLDHTGIISFLASSFREHFQLFNISDLEMFDCKMFSTELSKQERQDRHHQKSKTGYHWPHIRDLSPSKLSFEKTLKSVLYASYKTYVPNQFEPDTYCTPVCRFQTSERL